MRVAIVDTYYPAFVAAFYAARPALADAPYDVQLRALLNTSFGTSDAYSFHLRALSHETIDLLADVGPLQHRWAVDHGVLSVPRRVAQLVPGIRGSRAQRRVLRWITLRQIQAFQPDVVFSQNLAFFTRRELDVLRRRYLVVGQVASPLPPDRLVQGFHLVLTSLPHFVPRLRALGVQTEFFRLGVDPRVVDRVATTGVDPRDLDHRPYDVVFVGGVNPQVHAKGTAMLTRLAERRPVDVWGYGADALPNGSPLLERYHGEAWGRDMYRALAGARVAINRHIDVAEGHANNMRLFEATAMGAMLLTDAGKGLEDIFEPGREVLTYTSPDDLVEKIEHILAHDDERRAIAAAGQQRTLTDHSFARRMDELVEILQRHL